MIQANGINLKKHLINFKCNEKNKIVIIAEAGVNHNGQLENAIKLIDQAAKSGADYIKFQHTNPDLISPKAKKGQISNQEYKK